MWITSAVFNFGYHEETRSSLLPPERQNTEDTEEPDVHSLLFPQEKRKNEKKKKKT